jgi:hypothetical protein
MGAWGADSFDNDDALDWLSDFCDNPDEGVILTALKTVSEGESLAAADCNAGVAAAEIVAVLKGTSSAEVPEDVRDCLAGANIKPDVDLIETALLALSRIKSRSELKEVWDESESASEWYEALGDLESRLRH